MKRGVAAIGFLMLMVSSAFAQDDHHGQGYAFFAPGVTSSGGSGFAHFGGGGEALFKQVGVGAELGYLTPWREFSDGLGLFSANGSYHLIASTNGKVVPFATGGYSLFFRDGSISGFNFGGGVDYWMGGRTGVRFEVRDNVFSNFDTHRVHFIGFRVGVTFR